MNIFTSADTKSRCDSPLPMNDGTGDFRSLLTALRASPIGYKHGVDVIVRSGTRYCEKSCKNRREKK